MTEYRRYKLTRKFINNNIKNSLLDKRIVYERIPDVDDEYSVVAIAVMVQYFNAPVEDLIRKLSIEGLMAISGNNADIKRREDLLNSILYLYQEKLREKEEEETSATVC